MKAVHISVFKVCILMCDRKIKKKLFEIPQLQKMILLSTNFDELGRNSSI